MVLVELRNAYADVRNTTIHMSHTGSKFCHLVHIIDAFACKEVQTIKGFRRRAGKNRLVRVSMPLVSKIERSPSWNPLATH